MKQVELTLGSKAQGLLGDLVQRLKVMGNEAGSKINQYYKFSNNYIYEYISYNRLVFCDLS